MDITFWCSDRRVCTPQQWTEDHPHEPWSKLYLVRQGAAEYGISRDGSVPQLHRLEPGRLFLIPGGCRHRHACTAPFALDWCHFTIGDHALGARLAQLDAPRSWDFQSVVPGELRDEVIRHAHRAPADGLRAAGLVLQLLGRLPDPATTAETELRRRLAPATWYLDYHFRETISVEALARRVRLKPSRFQQLFRRLYGTGVYAHVLRLRVAEARRLLATTALPVQDVAARVGYADPFHFTRIFSRHAGTSPSAYRERTAPAG